MRVYCATKLRNCLQKHNTSIDSRGRLCVQRGFWYHVGYGRVLDHAIIRQSRLPDHVVWNDMQCRVLSGRHGILTAITKVRTPGSIPQNRVLHSHNHGLSWNVGSITAFPHLDGYTTVMLKDGSVLVTGGYNTGESASYRSNDGGHTWQTLPAIPLRTWRLTGHTMVVLDAKKEDNACAHKYGIIVLAGGETRYEAPVSDVYISRDGGDSWILQGSLPNSPTKCHSRQRYSIIHMHTGRVHHTMVASNDNTLFLIGGQSVATLVLHGDYLKKQRKVPCDDKRMSRDYGNTWEFVSPMSRFLYDPSDAETFQVPYQIKITGANHRHEGFKHALFVAVTHVKTSMFPV